MIVSTDSQHYADLASEYGAVVPGLRPPELSTDDASTDAAIAHVLQRWRPDATTVTVIQATTPFTTPATIRDAITRLSQEPRPATVVSAVPVSASTAFLLAHDGTFATFAMPQFADRRTQDVPSLAVPDGGVYVAPAQRVRSGGSLVEEPLAWIAVDERFSIDIDDPSDLAVARNLAELADAGPHPPDRSET